MSELLRFHKTISVVYRPKHYITDPALHEHVLGVYTTAPPDATEGITNIAATWVQWCELGVGDIVIKDWDYRTRYKQGDPIHYTFWVITRKNQKSVWTQACFLDGRNGLPTYGPCIKKFAMDWRTAGLWVIKKV